MESDNTSSHESFDLINPDDKTEEINESINSLLSLLRQRLEVEKRLEVDIWRIRRKFDAEYQQIHSKGREFIRKIETLQQSSFWVTVMGNCPEIWDEVYEVDLDVLDKLVDLRSFVITEDAKHESYPEFTNNGLVLEFEFAENDFFENKVLHKYYEISFETPANDDYTGAIPRCVGIKSSAINWKAGKNFTVKTISKRQQNKKTKKFRTITTEVARKSFFNFFTEPVDVDLTSEDFRELLDQDYELAVHFDSELVGRAVLYYADMVPASSDSDFSSADEYYDQEEEEEEFDDSNDNHGFENDSEGSRESEYDELKEKISELFKNHRGGGGKNLNKGKGPNKHPKPKRG